MRYHLISVLFIPLSLGCTQTETSAIQMVSVDSDLPPNQRDLGRTRGDVVDSRVPENPLPMNSAVVTDSTVPMDARDVFIELDGMTTRGDMGSQNSSMDAALVEDANVIPMGQCPMGAEVNACLFGMTSRQLLTREPLYVVLGPRHLDAVSLNALQQSQLVFGFECEGIFRPATAADALQMTDDGVQVLEIKRVNPTSTLPGFGSTWGIRKWDTSFGEALSNWSPWSLIRTFKCVPRGWVIGRPCAVVSWRPVWKPVRWRTKTVGDPALWRVGPMLWRRTSRGKNALLSVEITRHV